ncbi:hypothetical protein BS78_10G154700 [Paspalum vaginatum]|nr:hypothetical protein BS78_10G154700 [Paspalum vaginatum]
MRQEASAAKLPSGPALTLHGSPDGPRLAPFTASSPATSSATRSAKAAARSPIATTRSICGSLHCAEARPKPTSMAAADGSSFDLLARRHDIQFVGPDPTSSAFVLLRSTTVEP